MYQVTDAGRDSMILLLAEIMMGVGQLSDAHDLLVTIRSPNSSTPEYVVPNQEVEFKRRLMLGSIRHQQWVQAMKAASVSTLGSQGNRTDQRLDFFDQGWGAYSYDPKVWSKAGRNTMQLCLEAQSMFQGVLDIVPGHTPAALLLVQTALALGKSDSEFLRVGAD